MSARPPRIAPWSIVAVSFIASLSGAPRANADVVFNNFDSGGGFSPTNNFGTAFATQFGGSASAIRAAAKFTVTGANYTLDSVTLPISVAKSGVTGDFLRVRITTDAGGAPGTTLEVLSQAQAIWPAFSNPFTTTTTVASTAHPLLSVGTSYWIVTELTAFPAGNPMTLDYRWFSNTSGASVPFRQQQTNSATLPSDPWTGFNGSAQVAFRVDGTRPVQNCPLAIHADGIAVNDELGTSVAVAGDVNGDGYVDFIVGAPSADPANPGHAYLYLGGAHADGAPDATYTGEVGGDEFGLSVSSAGDVNGDGYADVIVGAPFNSAGGSGAGRAYIFYGGPVPHTVPDLTLTGESVGSDFGFSVAGVGDVNGNGTQDVVVGAFTNGAGGLNAGRAYIFDGGPGADAVPDLVITGVAGERLGRAVAPAGDINGDGHADFIIGAYHNGALGTNTGRAYIYFGGPGLDGVPDVTLTGQAAGDLFGNSVALAGDVNGDGYPDLIVGAQFNAAHGTAAGRAYVFFGGPGMDAVPDLVLDDGLAGDWYGYSVASAGDINGDGYPDVVVGAPNYDAGGPSTDDRGRAYVYFGGPAPDAVADMIYTGEAAGDNFGVSVAPVRKVFGPGDVGVLIGAYAQDLGGASTDNKGRAYVFECNIAPLAVTPIEPTTQFLGASPNPSTGPVELTLQLERAAQVSVRVFDVTGRVVARPIADEWLHAGLNVRSWRPTGLPSGVYHIRARVGDRESTRTLVWLGGR